MVILGSLLAATVAVTILRPQVIGDAAQFVGRNADFREAFAAVGRAVSGEEEVEDSLQAAYAAVFGPSEMSVRTEQPDDPECELSVMGESEEEDDRPDEAQSEESGVSGTYSMRSLPENASLELRNLGFCYTTPVKGTLTSAFGWREHPTEGGSRFHYGVDLAAEKGTEIVAFADGEVFAVGESSTLGKYIILIHAGGYRTLYAHCSEVLVSGGTVCMGDLIARVGESGAATGPHLHFELQDGTLYLNPIYYVSIW